MKRSDRIIDDQLKMFTKHLYFLIRELHEEGIEPEKVKELIYVARQYINRRNKAKKL